MVRMQRTAWLVALVALWAGAPMARAGVVLVDNTSSPRNDYWGIGDVVGSAEGKFTLTSGGSIETASLLLQDVTAQSLGLVSVQILNDNGGTPGPTVLGTSNVGSGTLDGSYSLRDFVFATPVDLNAGTYWLQASAPSAGASIHWGSTYTTNLVNTGTSGSVLSPIFSNSGSNVDPSQAYIFKLSGSTLSAVPEPGTLAGAGLGGMLTLLAAARRRCAQAV